MCSDKDAGKRENKTPNPCATYRQREKENQRIREREKDGKRQTDKETRKREGRKRERQRREREKSGPLSDFQHRVLSLSRFSPPLVAKLESMLRDALDEVSGLETMLVTARARVRRNETPFSLKAFSSKKFLSEHPFPQAAVLRNRLRRVAVQELAEEIGRRCSRPMPRRLKQRARSEGTEWASEPRCCSAVKKVSARTLHHLYFPPHSQ